MDGEEEGRGVAAKCRADAADSRAGLRSRTVRGGWLSRWLGARATMMRRLRRKSWCSHVSAICGCVALFEYYCSNCCVLVACWL